MSDIMIHSISFGDEMIEVTYMEERDKTARVAMMRTLLIDSNVVTVELRELEESAQELVDAALLAMRNPPKKIRDLTKDSYETRDQ